MPKTPLAVDLVSRLAGTLFPSSPVVSLVPLHGGLEAAVARLTIRNSEREQQDVILKRLTHTSRREAARYRLLASTDVTPSLLGSIDHEGRTYLFLEQITPVNEWPWRDSATTARVLGTLARLHRLPLEDSAADDWDYEKELRLSAAETIAVATDVERALPEIGLGRELRRLHRLTARLDELRHAMKSALGTTLIHGDVHSGNVMMQNDGGDGRVVLLDWGRSRVGSPLEDVSSWLLSLRTWEPAAARDHDTLLRTYLTAAGLPSQLTPALRDAYWYAGASNALAGALRYHLVVARDSTGAGRAAAVLQARAALRVLRRADERLARR